MVGVLACLPHHRHHWASITSDSLAHTPPASL